MDVHIQVFVDAVAADIQAQYPKVDYLAANTKLAMNKQFSLLLEREGWVRCADRLPEVDALVLVFFSTTGSFVTSARLREDKTWDILGWGDYSSEVHWWRTMPDGPADRNNWRLQHAEHHCG